MTTTEGPNLVVAERFCGPSGSGNGGYVAGRLADFVRADGPVEVTLREPPPLGVDLDVRDPGDGRTTLGFGGAVIAEARPAELAGHLVDPVDHDAALAAMTRYTGAQSHPFPECFVCGPAGRRRTGSACDPAGCPAATAPRSRRRGSRTPASPGTTGWSRRTSSGRRWTARASGPVTGSGSRWCSAG